MIHLPHKASRLYPLVGSLRLSLKVLILVCDCAGAAALVWLLNTVALIPYRRAKDSHWTERARALYPARVAASLAIWLLPADLALGQHLAWPELTPHWALVVLAGWIGVVAGTYPFDREVWPWLAPGAWLHQVFASWLIRFAVWFVFLGTVALMPEELDWRCWLLASLFVGLFLAWCWGGLLWVGRKLGVLGPAPERLRRIVADVAGRMGVPVRGVWLLEYAGSFAFALPYTRDLAFSGRLLERFPDEEVAAICAHELGHLAESKLTVNTRVFANLAWLAPWLFLKPLVHAFDVSAIGAIALASLLMMFGTRWFSRRLEERADRIAHTNEGEAGTYARALARLYEDNLIPAVLPRRRTHPDLYDRLLAVGVQPDFPRPARPSSWAVHSMLLLVLFGILIGLTFARLYP